MSNYLDALQWPAMAATVIGAWLMASRSKTKRNFGFWSYLVSNALWLAWGWNDHAYAVIALQLCLVALNIRGVVKTESASDQPG